MRAGIRSLGGPWQSVSPSLLAHWSPCSLRHCHGLLVFFAHRSSSLFGFIGTRPIGMEPIPSSSDFIGSKPIDNLSPAAACRRLHSSCVVAIRIASSFILLLLLLVERPFMRSSWSPCSHPTVTVASSSSEECFMQSSYSVRSSMARILLRSLLRFHRIGLIDMPIPSLSPSVAACSRSLLRRSSDPFVSRIDRRKIRRMDPHRWTSLAQFFFVDRL